MYSRGDPAKLLENDGDVPRNQEGFALIGDPRNDVHTFMNQMQVGFIRPTTGSSTGCARTASHEAERLRRGAARAHLALPVGASSTTSCRGLVGPELVDELLGGRRPLLQAARASRSFRSSSPTPRSATGTRRSASSTGSSTRRPELAVFPDLIGFCRARRSPRRLGAAVRRARTRAGSARQADRRPLPLPGGAARR